MARLAKKARSLRRGGLVQSCPSPSRFNVDHWSHRLGLVTAVRKKLLTRDECIVEYGVPGEAIDEWLKYTVWSPVRNFRVRGRESPRTKPKGAPKNGAVKHQLPQTGVLKVGVVQVDLATKKVTLDGEPMHFSSSSRDLRLLVYLMRHPGANMPKDRLFARLHPGRMFGRSARNSIETLLARLHRRLGRYAYYLRSDGQDSAVFEAPDKK